MKINFNKKLSVALATAMMLSVIPYTQTMTSSNNSYVYAEGNLTEKEKKDAYEVTFYTKKRDSAVSSVVLKTNIGEGRSIKKYYQYDKLLRRVEANASNIIGIARPEIDGKISMSILDVDEGVNIVELDDNSAYKIVNTIDGTNGTVSVTTSGIINVPENTSVVASHNIKQSSEVATYEKINNKYVFLPVAKGKFDIAFKDGNEYTVEVNDKLGIKITKHIKDIAVDKEKLREKIQKAQEASKLTDRYTKESIEEFMKEIEKAKKLLESNEATQGQVDNQVSKLQENIEKLIDKKVDEVPKKGANIALLKNEIENAENMLGQKNKYTEDSLADLDRAVARAKEVFVNVGATQEQVDEQTNIIKEKIKSLKSKPISTDEKGTVVPKLEDKIKDATDILLKEKQYVNDLNKSDIEALKKALEKANAVLNDKNSTKKQIEEQLNIIQILQDKLINKIENKNIIGLVYLEKELKNAKKYGC